MAKLPVRLFRVKPNGIMREFREDQDSGSVPDNKLESKLRNSICASADHSLGRVPLYVILYIYIYIYIYIYM